MAFFSRNATRSAECPPLRDLNLDALSDREVEAYLFDGAPPETNGTGGAGHWMALGGAFALGALVVGAAATGLDLFEGLFPALLVAGVVFYFARSKRCSTRNLLETLRHRIAAHADDTPLTRSTTDCKIAGVCGGVAERVGVNSGLVRFAVLLAALGTGIGPAVLVYLGLTFVLPKGAAAPGALTPEERLRIIRES